MELHKASPPHNGYFPLPTPHLAVFGFGFKFMAPEPAIFEYKDNPAQFVGNCLGLVLIGTGAV